MVGHKHILVVDDEPQITRVLRTTLSSCGYDIRVANDGETALEIMKDWSPDMVITDLAMPNMDGLGLIRGVRAGILNKFIPIIMLTTESQDSKKGEGKAAGATGWIVKPFKPEQLIAVIRKVLG